MISKRTIGARNPRFVCPALIRRQSFRQSDRAQIVGVEIDADERGLFRSLLQRPQGVVDRVFHKLMYRAGYTRRLCLAVRQRQRARL